jgi:hypothetical protein
MDKNVKNDPNVKALEETWGPYKGQMFSLLVSYGRANEQSLHIDMKPPNYQACMNLTKGPVTKVFPVKNVLKMKLGQTLTVEEFVDLLFVRLEECSVFGTTKEALIRAIKPSKAAVELVAQYGLVLAPLKTIKECELQGEGNEYEGYVGFPGGVVHCGPAYDGLRILMFSSYGHSKAEPYDPDSQYNAITLLAEVTINLGAAHPTNEDVLGVLVVLQKLLFKLSILSGKAHACDAMACLASTLQRQEWDEEEVADLKLWTRASISLPHLSKKKAVAELRKVPIVLGSIDYIKPQDLLRALLLEGKA